MSTTFLQFLPFILQPLTIYTPYYPIFLTKITMLICNNGSDLSPILYLQSLCCDFVGSTTKEKYISLSFHLTLTMWLALVDNILGGMMWNKNPNNSCVIGFTYFCPIFPREWHSWASLSSWGRKCT